MKLTDSQRQSLIGQMMSIVSSLPYRGFSRHWKELAEVDTLRVMLGMSFEDVSLVLEKMGLKLSIMSQTRIANGRDTHDGKPSQALQRELAKARAKTWLKPQDVGETRAAFKLTTSTTLADLLREVERRAPVDRADVVSASQPEAAPAVAAPRGAAVQQTLPLQKPQSLPAEPPVARHKVCNGSTDQSKLMLIDEVAKLLGTSVQQTRNMVGRGQLVKPLKVPGLGLRWRAADVNEWIQGLGQ